MKFTCGSCAAKYQIADEKIAGRTLKMKCRKCGHPIVVRGGSAGGVPRPEPSGRNRRPSLPGQPVSAAPAPGSVAPPPTRPSRTSGLGAEFRRQAATSQAAAAAAPAPGDEWHVAIDDTPVGPLSRDEVARRVLEQVIDESSLVWREGFEAWRPLSEVAELASLLRARPGLHRPPPMTNRRGATGRFGAARTTGRGASTARRSGSVAAAMPPPPPAPAGGFFPEDDADTELFGAPAFGGSAADASTATGGHTSRESIAAPPPRQSIWQNPGFVIAVIMAVFFSSVLALLVFKEVFEEPAGGTPVAQAPTTASPAPGREGAAAAVRIPDDAELERFAAREVDGEEPAPAPPADAPRAGSGASASAPRGSGDDGASGEPRAAAGRADPDLSDEDAARLARMRAAGDDFGGPTVRAREIDAAGGARGVGELDQMQVARVVNRNKRSLRQCYERAIRGVTDAPTITYDVNLTVAPSGRVSRVGMSSRGASLPGLDGCFESAIKRWVFPPSAEGQPVSFPVVLQPG